MNSTRAADINDIPGLSILNSKVRCGGAHELKRPRLVNGQHGLPLLVGHLVDHAVPGETCVVDDDMDFAVAEVGGPLDQLGVVGWVDDVAGYGDGLAAGFADGFCDCFGFGCVGVSTWQYNGG